MSWRYPFIDRATLVRITDEASEGCAESTRAKLRAVAETTESVAVGWFHCDGVQCPASQARRHNQRFQEAYDRAMAAQFEPDPDPQGTLPFEPFVVRVRP